MHKCSYDRHTSIWVINICSNDRNDGSCGMNACSNDRSDCPWCMNICSDGMNDIRPSFKLCQTLPGGGGVSKPSSGFWNFRRPPGCLHTGAEGAEEKALVFGLWSFAQDPLLQGKLGR